MNRIFIEGSTILILRWNALYYIKLFSVVKRFEDSHYFMMVCDLWMEIKSKIILFTKYE